MSLSFLISKVTASSVVFTVCEKKTCISSLSQQSFFTLSIYLLRKISGLKFNIRTTERFSIGHYLRIYCTKCNNRFHNLNFLKHPLVKADSMFLRFLPLSTNYVLISSSGFFIREAVVSSSSVKVPALPSAALFR